MKKLLLLLLFIPLVFSCSGSDLDTTYILKRDTTTANPQSLVFSQISLPDNNFTISQEEQTFTIKGLSSTNDVRVSLNCTCFTKPHTKDVLVNFYKDQTTTIQLTKHLQSSQGCSLGFTVTYN